MIDSRLSVLLTWIIVAWFTHYENAVLLYKTESIADIRKDFEGIFEQSQEIFSDTINPTWYQMMIKEVTQLICTYALSGRIN